MVERTRKGKFDNFSTLSNQIVSAQAQAEKLRARDGAIATPELERALSQVTEVGSRLGCPTMDLFTAPPSSNGISCTTASATISPTTA